MPAQPTGKLLYKLTLYTLATRKVTAILRHAAQYLFYFLQSTVYFIILSLSVNMFCIDRVLKFKYLPQMIQVKHSAVKACERMEVKLHIV
jgi:hypothetical protein